MKVTITKLPTVKLQDIPIGTFFQATVKGEVEPQVFFRCSVICFEHGTNRHIHTVINVKDHTVVGRKVYDCPTQEFLDYIVMDVKVDK